MENVETIVKKRRGRPAGSLGFKKVLEMHAKGLPVDPAVLERAKAKQKLESDKALRLMIAAVVAKAEDPLTRAAASAEENLYGAADDPADSVNAELDHETERALEMQTDEMSPRFPNVEVRLVGHDGNAFSVMGRVVRGLRAAGHEDAVDDFMKDAMSGDYDHLLQVAMKTVTVL